MQYTSSSAPSPTTWEEKGEAPRRLTPSLIANDNTAPFTYWIARILPLGALISILYLSLYLS